MASIRVYARNLFANWFGYLANIIIMFFLTPFVVYKLGDVTYGTWSLMISITGYLGLAEVGVRISTGRHLNIYLGRKDNEKASSVIGTSLAFYSVVSIVIFLAATMLGLNFPRLFPQVPQQLAQEARWLLILLSVNVWLSLFSATFAQLLHANDRFDLRSMVDVVVLLSRTVLIVLLLQMGHGIVAMTFVQVGSGLLSCLLLLLLARAKGARVAIRLRAASWGMARKIFGFGVWAFLSNVSNRIIHYTDVVVIALLLGPANVTLYAIAFMMITYSQPMLEHVLGVMVPEMTKRAGGGSSADVRWLVIRGGRMMLFFAVPLLVGFIVLGQEFIINWMGPEKAWSGAVLGILAAANLFWVANHSAVMGLWSLGHVRGVVLLRGIEASLNLGLSLLLVMVFDLGIVGIALGTLIPMAIINVGPLPVYACRKFQMPLATYAREIGFRGLASAAAFAPMCLLAQMLIPPAGWGSFWIKVILLALLYLPLGMGLVLGWQQSILLLQRLRLPVGGAAVQQRQTSEQVP